VKSPDAQVAEVAHSATISIGVATADKKMDMLSDLMKMADQTLYAAKRVGRNRVVCSVSEIAAPHAVPGDDCLAINAQPTTKPSPCASP
jgi:predicted signal transduction protein with EAL and GGDEF domain